ncbi:MAG TPA: hypothetical protein VG944_11365 [Fimbriimonas sp.]|nr:hypothetical protein [Fimbriimonas sp.]
MRSFIVLAVFVVSVAAFAAGPRHPKKIVTKGHVKIINPKHVHRH